MDNNKPDVDVSESLKAIAEPVDIVTPVAEPVKPMETVELKTVELKTEEIKDEKKLKEKKPPKKGVLVALIVAVVVLFASTVTLLVIVLMSLNNINDKITGDTTPQPQSPVKEITEEEREEINKGLGYASYEFVRWNVTSFLPSMPLVNEMVYEDFCEQGRYWRVADLSQDAALVRWSASCAMGTGMTLWFVIGADRSVEMLADYFFGDYREAGLAEAVTPVRGVAIGEVEPPKRLALGGDERYDWTSDSVATAMSGFSAASLASDAIELSKTMDGSFVVYHTEVDDWPLWRVMYRYITTDGRAFDYVPTDLGIQNDDGTLMVGWNDDAYKSITFNSPVAGCGGGRPIAVAESDGMFGAFESPYSGVTLDDIVSVGSVNGDDVYKIVSGKLFDRLYAEYSSFYSEGEEGWFSKEQFRDDLSNVLFRVNLDWVLMVNTKYAAGECGKPVVYLYPTETMAVDVSVGADVRISDPFYPDGGWKNVVADPFGRLTYQGGAYDYLFWEGRGHGDYPDLTGVGTVVTQLNLHSTIRQQLAQQGLNKREIDDFMEFWVDHLPKSKYVKLAWLTKAEMDTLAPLNVSPRPDTVIRVFLDAKGLQEVVELTPQRLTAPARKGFTVVEWGGLLQ